MIVLGLDTATFTSGIAVVRDGVVIAEARHDASGRTPDLLLAIDVVCVQAGVAPMQLEAIAVGAGPGSFTGLRIGMATAKGIAFAAGRPLWLVSSLAALAHDTRGSLPLADARRAGLVVAALDARRGEVFAGCYRDDALVGEERVLAPAELAGWVQSLAGDDRVTFGGDAIITHAEVLAPLAAQWTAVRTPSGAAAALCALAGTREDRLRDGAPTYIRPSEAEVMYPDGVPGALRRP